MDNHIAEVADKWSDSISGWYQKVSLDESLS